ncbi:HopJ type III effector protein [Sphingobacterium sp. LRF_L2]|uniref:HopJ type III effector protein n=1 Tax=Sphingobacterium sp. LRF_L2 TaxID=3369421 RepID=UPI003F5EB2D5
MQDQINTLLDELRAGKLPFSQVIHFIEERYIHYPTAFKNGNAQNEENQNQGSAKVFAFAKIHELSKENTLLLFAEHYQAVLDTPTANDHQNIRQFMECGWEGITFNGEALKAKI